jgi:hypothetical protein
MAEANPDWGTTVIVSILSAWRPASSVCAVAAISAAMGVFALLIPVLGETAPNATPPFHFTLLKGGHFPVCHAYLERLNTSQYEDYPYCDRPEDDHVPGFALLHRQPLNEKEKERLYPIVWELGNPGYPVTPYVLKTTVDQMGGIQGIVWTYKEPIDIENNGKPDKVVVWRGWGAQARVGACGTPYPSNAGRPLHVNQQIYILSAKTNDVDVRKTMAVFSRPNSALPKVVTNYVTGTREQFLPWGQAENIFEYRGRFYFDGFQYDPRYGYPNGTASRSIADQLGVFIHERGRTRKVCEYQMQNRQGEADN